MAEKLATLLSRASAGDQAAVTTLLAQHLPALRAFVRLKAGRLLLQRESCSDLAQSVCRDVLENQERFQFGSEPEFRKWLFTTAMRKIADRYEHWGAQKRAANREQSLGDEDLSAYAALCTPSQHAMAREDLERVEAAFDRLGQEQQDVILMSRLMGLPHKDIARELGKSEGAVRTMLSRSLAELAEHL